MENLLKLFNDNVKECYRKMNLVSLDTKRTSSHQLSEVEWEDFEVAVQLIQEYIFRTISELDKQMFSDELRKYLYTSKLQKNIATFSLCSPDSMRYLAGTYNGGDYCKVQEHAQLRFDEIAKVAIATDFSIGSRLGVDLAYDSDDYMIDRDYSITKSLKSLIKDCNPLRLQYCMSYCGRFVRLIHLFEDYFVNLAHETQSVTAIILGVSAFGIRRNISWELNDMNGTIQAMARSPLNGGSSFERCVKDELDKFNKAHSSKPSADDIKAEILEGIK